MAVRGPGGSCPTPNPLQGPLAPAVVALGGSCATPAVPEGAVDAEDGHDEHMVRPGATLDVDAHLDRPGATFGVDAILDRPGATVGIDAHWDDSNATNELSAPAPALPEPPAQYARRARAPAGAKTWSINVSRHTCPGRQRP